MTDKSRLIEHAFPLKQASLDSVHEKNVRHGHISTLHIWPARRPLAACRAALLATLLPDPGTPEARKRLVERIGGTVVKKIERKKIAGKIVEVEKEETLGGVLHWGRESSPDMDWFREEIRKAYDGRAPRVLDPFAGGGAIPLEAMRLGCETTAIDINPVAWFILKCTLEYPQKLAGQKRPLPDFVLEDREFMEAFFKAQGLKGAALRTQLERVGFEKSREQTLPGFEPGDPLLQADLAWHVRAWGRWVLKEAGRDLAKYYPTYAEFEPPTAGRPFEKREMRLVALGDDGTVDLDALNEEFTPEYLQDPFNARWVAKPTIAYLWARTVTCKNCRATIPLLKTRWLCKKDNKRVLLSMTVDDERRKVIFGVQEDVPVVGGNGAQRREHDRDLGAGTVTRSGAWCPCCGTPRSVSMTMDDIRAEGIAGRLGVTMTAVSVASTNGRGYRTPTAYERHVGETGADAATRALFEQVPFGLPLESIATADAPGFRVPLYGLNRWADLFGPRQLLALGTFLHTIGRTQAGESDEWSEAVTAYLAAALDRLADRSSALCQPDPTPAQSGVLHTFHRFALPMNWDFIEGVTIENASGGFYHSLEWIAKVIETNSWRPDGAHPNVSQASALSKDLGRFDVIVTDPPYYDAIAYSDLMDFFYVWLRRTVGCSTALRRAFASELGPKWDSATNDGELIDDSSRHGGDRKQSKRAYEDGMTRAFANFHESLSSSGRFVVVFAHKQPDAWESLVSGIVRSGFVVDGSWPIQTEMGNRMRALSSAALSSSVWLVCKKRPESARPGWDTAVLEEMTANIRSQLREFWDAGIRGPDFVWAATGPALEAFSKYPVVKKANGPGTMTVSEFLRAVRRIVVDFVVGRVLTKGANGENVSGLDDVTTYYLLHRNDFGLGDAPAGACILYAVSCDLSDGALADEWDILARVGGQEPNEDDADDDVTEDAGDDEGSQGTGSRLKLRAWNQRKRSSMGYDVNGRSAPLIDQIHRLMHLWRGGDQFKVDDYIEERNLRKNALFLQILQALIELAPAGAEERSLLESLSNHLAARGATPQASLPMTAIEEA